jgi:hypothetical protein
MHADLLGDSLQVQGAQVRDAVAEEPVLPTHDFRGDLQDRLGALVERAGEPGRVLQALAQEGLLGVSACRRGDAGIVGLVHEHPRQGVGIELDHEAAVRGCPHDHVRHEHVDRHCAEGASGLRFEGAELGQHLGEVLVVDAAQALQARQVPLRDEVEAGDERRHRGIEAVALAKLERETLSKVARTNSRRVEGLDQREHLLHLGQRRTEPLRELVERLDAVARLVDRVDQVAADEPLARVTGCQVELVLEMLGEARLPRERGLQSGSDLV